MIAVLVPGFDLETAAGAIRSVGLNEGGVAIASAGIAVVGLVASLFVQQAYCQFGCPTGTLLKFIHSGGTLNRFGVRDAVAGLLLVSLH